MQSLIPRSQITVVCYQITVYRRPIFSSQPPVHGDRYLPYQLGIRYVSACLHILEEEVTEKSSRHDGNHHRIAPVVTSYSIHRIIILRSHTLVWILLYYFWIWPTLFSFHAVQCECDWFCSFLSGWYALLI